MSVYMVRSMGVGVYNLVFGQKGCFLLWSFVLWICFEPSMSVYQYQFKYFCRCSVVVFVVVVVVCLFVCFFVCVYKNKNKSFLFVCLFLFV